MKHLRTIALAVIAMFTFNTNVAAQVETKAIQNFTINGGTWNKVIHNGDPVTIFSYKQDKDIHSFGIYSDDYAGVIDTKIVPFDIEQKALKKLPKNSKKSLKAYSEKACVNARNKALLGKYKTTAPDMLLTNDYDVIVSKNDPITVIGYKAVPSISGITDYYYAIIKKDGAGICDNSSLYKFTINNVPLPFLPSTDDPQVKSFIAKQKQTIKDRKAAEMEAYYEKQRIAAAEKAAQKKAMEEERMENLKMMDPAYIEVKGWNMNSVGGIAVNITFTNCDRFHSIKYVYFQGYFLNAVGDKCRNSINGSTVWKYTGVGPINPFPSKPGQYGQSYIANYCFDDPLFYAKTAHTFHLSAVTIEYTNGKKKVLTGDELDCRVDYTY